MKIFKILVSLCAVLFLWQTSGAQIISAQNKSAKSTDKSTSAQQKTAAKIATSQATSPVVTQVDFIGLKNVLKKSAEAKRPLLVNFWATWCPPCREEFPELVKIDAEYRAQNLDFITVSLDDLAEIKREVPQFLAEMKATMPAYLLKTADEEAAIAAIAPGWRGGLPLTILYNADGKMVYSHMQAINPRTLREQIDKVLNNANQTKENTKHLPKVNQIDENALLALLKPNGDNSRPLIIYFWATWCAPCRAKFPDLVSIDREFRAKNLEFVVVSLDNLTEINDKVPLFLNSVGATMPAYLLTTTDKQKILSNIPLWSGNAGTLILFDANREVSYFNDDSVRFINSPEKRSFSEILRSEIEMVLAKKQ